jgi:cysteine desulfurase/selenocysteine lyase
VRFSGTTWAPLPAKFEAGTPDIAAVAGLGAAISYLEALGFDAIAAHEHELLEHATALLREIDGLRLVGTAPGKAAVVSWTMDGVHPHDVGTILDGEGIAIRAGHHCAQPLMERLGVPATARASFAFYNTHDEIDALAAGLHAVRAVFG